MARLIRIRQEPRLIDAYISLNLAGYRPVGRTPQPLRRQLQRDLQPLLSTDPVRSLAEFLRRRFSEPDEYRTAIAPLFLPMNPWHLPRERIKRWIAAIAGRSLVRAWRQRVYLPYVRRVERKIPHLASRAQRYAHRALAFFGARPSAVRIDVHLNPLDTPGYGSTYEIGTRQIISVSPLPRFRLPRETLLHELLHCSYAHRRVVPFRFPRSIPVPPMYGEHTRGLRQEEYAVRAAIHLILEPERTPVEQRRSLRDDVRYGFRALPGVLQAFKHNPTRKPEIPKPRRPEE